MLQEVRDTFGNWEGRPAVKGFGLVGELDTGLEGRVVLVMGWRWRVRIRSMVLRGGNEMEICILSMKNHNTSSARLVLGRNHNKHTN